jgi:hypothetical protein
MEERADLSFEKCEVLDEVGQVGSGSLQSQFGRKSGKGLQIVHKVRTALQRP